VEQKKSIFSRLERSDPAPKIPKWMPDKINKPFVKKVATEKLETD